jgi:hypothetical protein
MMVVVVVLVVDKESMQIVVQFVFNKLGKNGA